MIRVPVFALKKSSICPICGIVFSSEEHLFCEQCRARFDEKLEFEE